MNKTSQGLKVETETTKETQNEANLKIKVLGKKTGTTDISIPNRILELEEKILGIEDIIEDMNISKKI